MRIKPTIYYSPDDAAGTSPEGEPPAVPSSAAAAAAKFGRVTTDGNLGGGISSPSEPNTNQTAQAASQQTPPAEPAKPASTPESAKPEETAPEQTQQTPPAQKEQAPADKGWQEVLKSQKPDVILKELGFDDELVNLLADRKSIDPKMVNLIRTWEDKKDVKEYLEALTVDYTKMAPADVMRIQLQRDYPNITGEKFEILYQAKVVDQYKLDPETYTADEVNRGQVLLEADVQRVVQQLETERQSRLLPPAPEAKQPAVDVAAQEAAAAQQKAMDEYRAFVDNHSLSKQVVSTGKMYLGDGDAKFTLDIPEPNNALSFIHEMGGLPPGETPDESMEKALLLETIVRDHKGFLKAFADHHQAIGAKRAIDPIENASVNQSQAGPRSEPQPGSPAAAAAKQGRLVSG